ncbi:HAD-IA family hydrolase [Thermosulfuriphilus ammonigenes]|uniref:HAD-IA family hydrolase n=1 Tax=Thermosulfuriphilus ammonigenes TaxID=1936021 RepID=A0A6G7PX31_9BACT|nr:HAD-IA family hydrolase [Thermosulfuriphilus ammonigenes]MBA2847790.1 putative hydrolase of the HAD superfamily [Thermosulfuriphilus ammonigenes]QIJ72008.1 HAD-IA family hydrolase [Thermosulfuriphilus ammonigenes]
MKIKALLFDAEGTLFHIHPTVGAVYAKSLRGLGIKVDPEILEDRFRQAWRKGRLKLRANPSPQRCQRIWRQIFSQTVAGLIPPDLLEPAFRLAYQAFGRREAFRLAAGARRALSWLKEEKILLAIVSNWDGRLRELLVDFGLHDYFEAIVLACEAKVAKPDPRILKVALNRLGVTPQQAVLIGNDPEEDLPAAKSLGMPAVLYRQQMDLFTLCRRLLSVKDLSHPGEEIFSAEGLSQKRKM